MHPKLFWLFTAILLVYTPRATAQRNYDVQMRVLESAAQGLHLELQLVRMEKSGDVENAFLAMTRANVRAFFLLVNPYFGALRNKILDLAFKTRLPGTYSNQDWVNAGGLMTYGPDRIVTARRLAVLLVKFLRARSQQICPWNGQLNLNS